MLTNIKHFCYRNIDNVWLYTEIPLINTGQFPSLLRLKKCKYNGKEILDGFESLHFPSDALCPNIRTIPV